jgi:hypothetical protein
MRVMAFVAVCTGVAALAAGTFVLSYAGMHAVALQAGVSHRLARGYPLMFDVLLVVILAALLALRGAGWPSRILAWICLLALLAAAAGADALHAAGHRLPARPAAVTAAVLPWALVLIAFVLLLAMLRQARLRRLGHAGPAAGPSLRKLPPPEPPPLPRQPLVPGFPAQAPLASGPDDTLRLGVPRQVRPELAATAGDQQAPGPAATGDPVGALVSAGADRRAGIDGNAGIAAATDGDAGIPAATDGGPAGALVSAGADGGAGVPAAESPAPASGPADGDLAMDAELAPDDPSSDETALDPAYDPIPYPADSAVEAGSVAGGLSPAPTAAGSPAGAVDDDMPVFHRMWSAPVPPSGPALSPDPAPTAEPEAAAESEPVLAADEGE